MKRIIYSILKKIPLFRSLFERISFLEKRINELELVVDYNFYKGLHPDNYADALKSLYRMWAGKTLDIENPQTFNEKIQWLKLYDSTPIKTRLADKYLVRDWVKERIGEKYLIPLLGTWDKFDDIDFDEFPEQFVLKANHGCGWNIIVKDKHSFDVAAAKEIFNRWLNTNFAFVNGLELHYKDIPPKIIAEQYLENYDGDLYDYKVFCFNGIPYYIGVDRERHTNHKRNYYDLRWNLQPFSISKCPQSVSINKPYSLDEMIYLAKILSRDFAIVRVDFYLLNDSSLKFGELTFTPESGMARWNPPEYDLILGQMITLPER
ncbi:MAG: hypothetical protein JW914_08505 [Syntrophaceae bacterium]|nr:hypothetical protein [Syntrophaceae bacterium]